MKVRKGLEHDDEVTLNMTSMIDIVFQLLVFFIMTFKIVVQEGDFNIRMPAAVSGGSPSENIVEPLRITLEAFETNEARFDGRIRSIEVKIGDTPQNPPPGHPTWSDRALRDFIDQDFFKRSGTAKQDAEAILVLHPKLKYAEVIKIITAISGKLDPDSGDMIKLFQKISFERPPEL